MVAATWGTLRTGDVLSTRRVRTFGMASAVRHFNERAVPGMGGLWFGRQLILAALGIFVAEAARSPRLSNIQVANALEAAGCWLTFTSEGWTADPVGRLQGIQTMRDKVEKGKALDFATASRRGFYVSQPMRRNAVQPLSALGYVEKGSQRFNAYRLSLAGVDLVEAATEGFRPQHKSVVSFLGEWVHGNRGLRQTPQLKCLFPAEPLPADVRHHLLTRITNADTAEGARRAAVVDWLGSSARPRIRWGQKSRNFDQDHWCDLHRGANLQILLAACDRALAHIEAQLGNQKSQTWPVSGARRLRTELDEVRAAAAEFLTLANSGIPTEAIEFAHMMSTATDVALLRELLRRDGRILQLRGDAATPGAAFAPWQVDAPTSQARREGISFIDVPPGVSDRIWRMALLDRDLTGRSANVPVTA